MCAYNNERMYNHAHNFFTKIMQRAAITEFFYIMLIIIAPSIDTPMAYIPTSKLLPMPLPCMVQVPTTLCAWPMDAERPHTKQADPLFSTQARSS